jgi:hypothetical protein
VYYLGNKKDFESFKSSLKEGLKYPWNKASRLWYILWLLFPIFGWFALLGYFKRIVRELVKGNKKQLPEFGKFWENFKQGIMIFIFMIPTFLVMAIVGMIPFIGQVLSTLINVFLLPWLMINFFVKETFDSLWEIKKAFNIVFENAIDYIFAYLKTLIFSLIYILLCFVLVGIPCYLFGSSFYLAEFYKSYKIKS